MLLVFVPLDWDFPFPPPFLPPAMILSPLPFLFLRFLDSAVLLKRISSLPPVVTVYPSPFLLAPFFLSLSLSVSLVQQSVTAPAPTPAPPESGDLTEDEDEDDGDENAHGTDLAGRNHIMKCMTLWWATSDSLAARGAHQGRFYSSGPPGG